MMGVMAERLVRPAEESLPAHEFGPWMMAEQRRVFLICCRMLQDKDEADMAVQDTFLKAYQALIRNDAAVVENPKKWLTRIAVNTCLDRLRSRSWRFWRSRPPAADEELILAIAPATGPTAEDRVYAAQIQRRLAAAMEKLSARQRAVFTLRHYENHRLEEIADILGLDTGTVKAHMARALNKLRAELDDLYQRRNQK